MPFYMATYHSGPLGLGPNVPARWQHGPTPGVKVLSCSRRGPREQQQDDQRHRVRMREPSAGEQLRELAAALCPKIEVRSVTDYMPNIQNYEARDLVNWPVGSNLSEDQKRAAREIIQRYIDAPTPAEAIRLWLETENVPAAAIPGGGVGGAQTVRNAQVAKSLNLD